MIFTYCFIKKLFLTSVDALIKNFKRKLMSTLEAIQHLKKISAIKTEAHSKRKYLSHPVYKANSPYCITTVKRELFDLISEKIDLLKYNNLLH